MLSAITQKMKTLNIKEALIKFSPHPESKEATLEGIAFIIWLKTQTKRQDGTGKLSRLITEDVLNGHFPQKASKNQIIMHLISHNIPIEGRVAFISAWSEFEKIKKLHIVTLQK
jgi:hypothetical protein